VANLVDPLPKPLQYLIWSFKDFSKDNGPQWAAALAYYALLSIFPLMLAALSIAAFFVDPAEAADRAAGIIRQLIPTSEDEVRQIVFSVFEARGGASIISVALLLWTGSQVFGVATQALNIAFDADEKFTFIKRVVVQLTMAATLGLLFIAALLSHSAIDFVWRFLGLGGPLVLLGDVLKWVVPFALLVVALYLAYRWVPRCSVHARPAWIGALVATVAFMIARPVFGYYVSRFANYNLVYGSLAAVIILIFWAWLTAQIFLFGGQLASLIEALEHRGKDREEVAKRHELRSPVRKLEEQGESPA
jgi:membrane protein